MEIHISVDKDVVAIFFVTEGLPTSTYLVGMVKDLLTELTTEDISEIKLVKVKK